MVEPHEACSTLAVEACEKLEHVQLAGVTKRFCAVAERAAQGREKLAFRGQTFDGLRMTGDEFWERRTGEVGLFFRQLAHHHQ